MRVLLSAGLIAILSCASCLALDQEKSKPPKSTPLMRVEAFAKHLSHAVTALPREVVPIVTAVDDELSSELRSDWPQIREELSSQMSHLSPWRRDRQGQP